MNAFPFRFYILTLNIVNTNLEQNTYINKIVKCIEIKIIILLKHYS